MKQRIEWIDMAKGLGIVLMIYGHTHFCYSPIKIWLYSFHMPLFFFLSGVTFNLLKYTNFKDYLKNKAKTLLIPYMFFAFVILCWRVVLQIIRYFDNGILFDFKLIFRQVLGIFLQIRGSDFGIGVWFLPCIFITFLLLYVVNKLSKGNNLVKLVLGICGFCVGYCYCNNIGVKLPWGIDAAFIALLFVILGHLYAEVAKNQSQLNDKKRLVVCIAGGGICNIIFTYLNYKHMSMSIDMWGNRYGNPVFFLLEALGGIVFIIAVSKLIHMRWISRIGKNSLIYYGVHIVLVEAIELITIKIVADSMWRYTGFVTGFIELAMVLFLIRLLLPAYKGILQKKS